MIEYLQVQGDRSTTWHDITVEQDGMTLTISEGSYWRGGGQLAELVAPTTIEIDTPVEDTQLEVWLTATGEFELIQPGGELPDGAIDRIAWLTVPDEAVTLDDVPISVIQIQEGSA